MKKYLWLSVFLCYSSNADVNFVIESDSDIELIQANSTEYYDDNVKLVGNVVIKYGDKDIKSDFITISLREKNITASGNITIEDAQHNVINADSIHIKNGFKNGFLKKIKLTLADRSYLKADDASFIGSDYFEMNGAEYSPCYECVKDDKLTWRIRAKRVEQNAESMIYHNAFLEVLNIPVIYMPYLSVPNIKIKRKSGFLYPLFTCSKTNGLVVCPRYLYSISKSKELILKPLLTTKTGQVLWSSYAQRFNSGRFDIDASITGIKSLESFRNYDVSDDEYKKIKSNNYRGHVFANFAYDIDKKNKVSAKINLVSDKYYLRKIPFLYDGDVRLLENNVNVENFTNDNYSSIKACYFQTLRPDERNEDIPLTLPIITHGSTYDVLTGTMSIDMLAMRLNFANSHATNKIFANVLWKKDFMLRYGHILTYEVALASSFNCIGYKKENISNSSLSDVSPMVGLIWQWPLRFQLISSKLFAIIKPIIGAIYSPNRRVDKVYSDPYTSVDFFELNSANFLELIRTPLSSQLNDGARIPHGIKGDIYNGSKHLAEFLIGRSFNLSDVKNTILDLRHKYSNVISDISLYPFDHVILFMNGSYSSHDGKFQRIESGVKYDNETFVLKTSVFRYNIAKVDKIKTYKGIHMNIETKISRNTSVIGEIITGGSNCKILKKGLGISYKNECAALSIMYSHHYFHSGDIKPDRAISLVIAFKNLGKTGFKL